MGNSKIVYYGETLIDLTGDTVEAAKLLKGVTAHDKKGEKVTGTLADVTQATPAITVDAAGKITASATQAAGVVAAGTKSATKQLTVQAAKTVTPSASAQTAVAKGVFTTGIVTVAAVYAVIGVTYPAGSTVTCTNGSKTLRAKDTTGKALFVIPSAGTWTVKAVKGSQSASKAVSITAEGQVATVVLAYEWVIYNKGSFGKNTDGTTFDAKHIDDNYNSSSITKNSTDMLWECGRNAWCIFYIDPKVNCTGYKTLKISLTNASTAIDSADENIGKFGLKSNNDIHAAGFVAKTTFKSLSGSHTLSLDISKVGTTPYYIAIQFGTLVDTGFFSARVTKIWLE